MKFYKPTVCICSKQIKKKAEPFNHFQRYAMKKSGLLALLVVIISWASFGQNSDEKFKKEGKNSQSISINQSFSESSEIFPFGQNGDIIYGLDATADIELNSENSLVRIILVDNNFNEYLIYESYNLLLEEATSFSVKNICEETSILDGVKPYSVQIEIKNAQLKLKSISYSSDIDSGFDIEKVKKEKKKNQNEVKIKKINNNLKKKGKHWIAGVTSVSELNYGERKKLYGQSSFPAGFEYYTGGVITAGSTETDQSTIKSATTTTESLYVDEWDWRNRHGKDWITPVTNQETCGSCWAFATTGATEAIANLYFNQQLNLDLSEQEILSCTGPGNDCGGGYPKYALDYITSNGIVDEATFPYSSTYEPCENKGTNPSEKIKIGGRINFDQWTQTEDELKDMLIKTGPVSGGVVNWSHAMVLVGYKVIKEGDFLYYSEYSTGDRYWKSVLADDPLIGKTVWIFKNSWGSSFGDQGYIYIEQPIEDFYWTHAIKTPVTSVINNYEVKCVDNDGDGYYYWGLGEKPANCPECPDLADGNDADENLGPLDEYGNCTLLTTKLIPEALFSSNKTEITIGDSITFKDLSENSPTKWAWTFEGGTPATSDLQNPTITYNNSGTFEVTLTVTNLDGSSTKVVDNYIWVNDLIVTPIADFTADKTIITKGETVQFTDISTRNPDEWYWIFAGGTPGTSSEQNPTVTYNSTGSFKVTLYAINEAGWNGKEVSNFITVNEQTSISIPVANFTVSETTTNTDKSITFTDLSTNSPTSWEWTFEGGNPATSTEQNPVVTYNTAGTYSVTLTATNEAGSNTQVMDNYIEITEPPVFPVANFTASTSSVLEGETVTFTDLSSDASSWNWIFEGGAPATSTAQNPTITYATPGNYYVTLIATNNDGSDTTTLENYIQVNEAGVAPTADFSASKTSITAGETVTFTDLSLNEPSSWSWTFEGGTPGTSTKQNPSVIYTSAGTYSVTLIASNEAGPDTIIMENYIQVDEYIPSYCIPTTNAGTEWIAGVEIDGQSNTSGSNGYSDFTSFGFEIKSGGNQNIVLTPGFISRSKFEYWAVWIDLNQDMIFSDSEKLFSSSKSKSEISGTLFIPAGLNITTRMRVAISPTEPSACDDLIGEIEDYSVHIFEPAPVADFTASSTNVAIGESVQFTNTSLYNPTSLLWNFEGVTNSASSSENPIVSFDSPGEYLVTLIASNDAGTSQKSMAITVYNVDNNTTLEYCSPENVSSSLNYIRRIVFAGFDIESGADGYQLSASAMDNIVAGQDYTVELYPYSNTTRNYWQIWIDFNNDGDFDDSGEMVLQINNKKGVVIGTISIPFDASESTRMRVVMKVGSAPLSSCDAGFVGEVEDYEVSFDAPRASAGNPFAESDLEQNSIVVYPNPTVDYININIDKMGFNNSYSVFNISGKKVIEGEINSSVTRVNLSEYPSGIYLIKVMNDNQSCIKKIIKKD